MGEMANSRALSNSSLCFSRPSLLCAALLVPSFGFICFLSFEFFPFLLTISILILSTILLLTNTKKKVILDEKPVGIPLCGQEYLPDIEDEVGEHHPVQEVENEEQAVRDEMLSTVETEKENQLVETVTQAAQQSENGKIQVEHFSVPSDCEFRDESLVPSENFELNWMCSSSASQKAEITDGFSADDDDDDDSLIEINLPGSELVGEPKQKLLSKFPDFLPADSIFRQQGLREVLADINEMNEEENLIEIDISMGSIKCPSFEIEA